ncbi:Lipoprotein LpqB beta-propeller domain-containing protein [Amycolatopsis arida]|uniref:Lipoprotein LpqB beta-propeller domain-containing protein n=1 Tax=Amycolatopsis arida TaxID=587909 RepID=A0A1I5PJ65_9PSEU|nr:LpqB family beta-propeller domain-containing protein [Amycolatopsis arida]TDX98519.1 lipoprotein LpqB-like beta-propeller protein [Amycolatopsis arida]SFP34085.1 Lipoprotein LpqB beta-propeller domain-containing protein [Amycolatopsis arida]
MRAVLAVLAGLTLVTGCATVPAESQPEVVTGERLGQMAPDIPEPAKDLDVLTLVRDFVRASARSTNDYATARVYLDSDARKMWRPAKGVTVIEDKFDTVYAVGEEQPADPNEQVVVLRGVQVGRLGQDSAFIPTRDVFQQQFRVRRQADGQWRIVDPPTNVVVTESDFGENYLRVPLYFVAPEPVTLVPDLRYVPKRPQSGLPDRVVDLLLSGPSQGLAGAVRNPLGDDVRTEGNVTVVADGALVVPLKGVQGRSKEDKELIAAQIVRSLQPVTSSRIRLLSDGTSLVSGQPEWRPSDLPAYDALTVPSSDLPGLVSVSGRIRSLADGTPIHGPAGAGVYPVETAAQSIDGQQLAIVERVDGRARLRIGDLGREAVSVDLTGDSLTRPSWRPSAGAGTPSGEVWTVRDGGQVVRVLRTPAGGWVSQTVSATEVTALGTITALRLSRDGTRAAVVAGGQLVVASVIRTPDSVNLRSPRILQPSRLTGVVDVDWATQDTLVVATSTTALPVARVPVDGLRMDKFNSSNLTPPVHAVTAAPSRAVVVADSIGLWTANDIGEVWRPHDFPQGPEARPFYPG